MKMVNEKFVLRDRDRITAQVFCDKGEFEFSLVKNARIVYQAKCFDIDDLKSVLKHLLYDIIDELEYRGDNGR